MWFKSALAIKPSVKPFLKFSSSSHPLGPPPVTLSMHHAFTNSHTNVHKDTLLSPPWQAPHILTSKWAFLWSCHKVITPWFSQRWRNRLREDGILTWEWVRVWQREMSPTLLCSLWTSRMVPTNCRGSHVQLKKKNWRQTFCLFSLVKRLSWSL